ncbi:MAG: spore coat protein, partial [bacterium]|nr:spore coat protein [bacterium]
MLKIIAFVLLLLVTASCSLKKESPDSPESPESVGDWTDATHSNKVPPNFDIVFAGNKVHRIDVVIAPGDWQAMQDDMTAKFGTFGSEGGSGGGVGATENPIFVPCSITYQEKQWHKVGIRYKGNSSLNIAWTRGIGKIALKFDFDEFENQYPEIKNQRFYGFKQLSMSSNFIDPSLLRERAVADIFRESDVAAPHTAFCRIYVDHGDGPIYFGLYTMVEVVDDTLLEDQFGDDSGNCYKPEGDPATFSYGSFTEAGFVKKSNKSEADWSDILALYDALHSETRSADAALWRSQLEAVFDVETFLRWLAVNTLVQNWDTYGRMRHNYYLYNNPENNRLTWIPWDNNEALQEGKMGDALSLGLSEIDAFWPLIRFLLDEPVYYSRYASYVKSVAEGAFHPEKMAARYRELHDLIQPYVTGNDGEL